MVYSRHSQWDTMIKRGVKLYLLGVLVNVFEFFIPHFLSVSLGVNAEAFPLDGGWLIICVDILAFAGMAFVLMGILKKFKLSNKKLIVIAVAMSILGTLLAGTDFGVQSLNSIFGFFIIVSIFQYILLLSFNFAESSLFVAIFIFDLIPDTS